MTGKESIMEEHIRLNPDLVRASEADLRELAGHGEAAAANELRRRRQGAAASKQGIRVREVLAEDVKVGQVVWAHDDGDWMTVRRIDSEGDGWMLTFYRADQSLAEFDAGKTVLVREDSER